jgi:riboflavin synthase
MFTGLIETMGKVSHARRDDAGLELVIGTQWLDVQQGESIAVDGACLTVTDRVGGDLTFHIIRTSLDRTNFGTYAIGRWVNLERALRVGDRLGGHLVQGHVDGVGTILEVREREDARLVDIEVPPAVSRISVPLGSITVDGVSLTVNAIPAPGIIQISLIPFTLQHTTLGQLRPGERVHLEADTIGKYVDQLMRRDP